MSLLRKFSAGVRALFRKEKTEKDLDEELSGFIEAAVEQKMRAGMSRDEALRAARIEMGSVAAVRDQIHESGWESLLYRLWQNTRYAARMVRKNPRFTIASVLMVALGIGANTAIFSVVDGVLLRPLPYPEPDRLYSVQEKGLGIGNPTSYPDAADWRSQNRVFDAIATYHGQDFTLTGNGDPLHLLGEIASSDLLTILKVQPLLGRGFLPQDEQQDVRVALLSHSLWREKFHSDPGIVGQGIILDQHTFTVIGVMPPGFQFPPTSSAQLWVNSAVDRKYVKETRGYMTLSAIGRLKTGGSVAQAQADMDLIAQRLARQYPENNARLTSVRLMPLLDRTVGSYRLPLLILLGVVAVVLLIACANLANLSLARNLERQRELAVRAALGAGRRRLLLQLLTESLLLSLLGGLGGLLLAIWTTPGLLAIVPGVIPRAQQIGLDHNVLGFAVLLTVSTTLLFGLLPAYESSKTDLLSALNDARRIASPSRGHQRFRGLLVTVETALAVLLLTGAGLLISSYLRLTHTDPGLDPHSVLTFNFDLASYTTDQELNFYNTLLPALERLPGVKSAVGSWPLPFFDGEPSSRFEIKGRSFPAGQGASAGAHVVTTDYFRTMGMRLVAGRDFAQQDTLHSNQVVIVDEAFARTYFTNENPIGKSIKPSLSMSDEPPWREIVGVVNSTRDVDLSQISPPRYYIPFAQLPGPQPSVLVKTEADPLSLAPAIRTIMKAMDKNVAIYDLETLDQLLSASVARQRFNGLLFGLFAALALTLAAMGIYSVVSYTVAQMTREIGIRMALGASSGDVLATTIKSGLKHVVLGMAVGVAAAMLLTQLLSSMLYSVRPRDPVTLFAVCIVLFLVALIASYVPGWRATRIDPILALRYE